MKDNYKIVFIISLLVGTILYCLITINIKEKKKIVLITYDRFLTLQDDGGTHSDTRYEIDFKKKEVVKLEDYYKGFEGLQYKDKALYKKSFNETEGTKLKELFADIIENKESYGVDREHAYMYYELQFNDEEIKIYDKTIIQKLEELLKER